MQDLNPAKWGMEIRVQEFQVPVATSAAALQDYAGICPSLLKGGGDHLCYK